MITKLFTALVTAVGLATLAPAPAHANGGLLTVGMKLVFKSGNCSLGFFATDSVGDQLAITAGHCAHGLNEKVYNAWGQQIGEVVAWQLDVEDGNGKLTGSRGFTVVYTYKTFNIEAFFTRVGIAKIGDRVRLYGQRTSGTNGTVTNVSYTTGHPDLDLLTSDVAQLPGDSGGPLFTQGPTLVGIASSVNDATRREARRPSLSSRLSRKSRLAQAATAGGSPSTSVARRKPRPPSRRHRGRRPARARHRPCRRGRCGWRSARTSLSSRRDPLSLRKFRRGIPCFRRS
jgi:hypothetical protein